MSAVTLPRASTDGQLQTYKHFEGTGGSYGIIRETISAAAAATITLKKQLPANSIVTAYALRCTVTGVISTGTSMAIGYSGNVDAIAEVTFGSYDAVNDNIVALADEQVLKESATSIIVTSTDGSQNTSGTFTSGSWDLTLYFIQYAESVAV